MSNASLYILRLNFSSVDDILYYLIYIQTHVVGFKNKLYLTWISKDVKNKK